MHASTSTLALEVGEYEGVSDGEVYGWIPVGRCIGVANAKTSIDGGRYYTSARNIERQEVTPLEYLCLSDPVG